MRDLILERFLWWLTITLWVASITPSSCSASKLILSEDVSPVPLFSDVTFTSGLSLQHTDGIVDYDCSMNFSAPMVSSSIPIMMGIWTSIW